MEGKEAQRVYNHHSVCQKSLSAIHAQAGNNVSSAYSESNGKLIYLLLFIQVYYSPTKYVIPEYVIQ